MHSKHPSAFRGIPRARPDGDNCLTASSPVSLQTMAGDNDSAAAEHSYFRVRNITDENDAALVGVPLQQLDTPQQTYEDEDEDMYASIFPEKVHQTGDKSSEQTVTDRAGRLFDALDVDDDGTLSKSDLKAISGDLGETHIFKHVREYMFRESRDKWLDTLDEEIP